MLFFVSLFLGILKGAALAPSVPGGGYPREEVQTTKRMTYRPYRADVLSFSNHDGASCDSTAAPLGAFPSLTATFRFAKAWWRQ